MGHGQRHPRTAGATALVLALAVLAGCSGAGGTHGTRGAHGTRPASSGSADPTGPRTGARTSGSVPGPTGSGNDRRPGGTAGGSSAAAGPGGTPGSRTPEPAGTPGRTGPVPCASGRTRVVLDRSARSTGTITIRLRFGNRGMRACLLRAGPAVDFLDGMGARAPVPFRAGYGSDAPVLLPVGGTATATVRTPDPAAVPASSCRSVPVSRIRVRTSSGDADAAMLTYSGRICADPSLPTVIGPFTRPG